MEIIVILGLIGSGVLSVLAASESLQQLRQKQKARQKLRKELLTVGVEKKLVESLSTVPPDPKSIQEARDLINKSLENLNQSYQDQIREGLEQPSKQGQINFVVSILQETFRFSKMKDTNNTTGCT